MNFKFCIFLQQVCLINSINIHATNITIAIISIYIIKLYEYIGPLSILNHIYISSHKIIIMY